MSIYATLQEMALPVLLPVRRNTVRDAFARVWLQGVPCHIDDTGPIWDEWLPAPRPGCGERCGAHYRAVFVCGPYTSKATERNGQEYVHPVLVFDWQEWDGITWADCMDRIEEALETHMREGRKHKWPLDVCDIIPDPFASTGTIVRVKA